MEEIKEGEYVRTKEGNILKCDKLKDTVIWTEAFIDIHCKYNEGIVEKNDILKHSFNSKNLIKVGDVIQYRINKISTTLETKGYLQGITDIVDNEMIKNIKKDKNYHILSIVTKEQFKAMEYKVEE